MATPNPDLEAYIERYESRGWTLIENAETQADFEQHTSGYPKGGWLIASIFFPVVLLIVIPWIIYALTGKAKRYQRLHIEVGEDGQITLKKQWREAIPISN